VTSGDCDAELDPVAALLLDRASGASSGTLGAQIRPLEGRPWNEVSALLGLRDGFSTGV
jgi:hypothetical protein